MGTASPRAVLFIKCIVANPPMPKKAACPKESSPAWPIKRLKARANNAAMSALIAAFKIPSEDTHGMTRSPAPTSAITIAFAFLVIGIITDGSAGKSSDESPVKPL
jgi:hypothetical protein